MREIVDSTEHDTSLRKALPLHGYFSAFWGSGA